MIAKKINDNMAKRRGQPRNWNASNI